MELYKPPKIKYRLINNEKDDVRKENLVFDFV